jgi:septum formation protein
MADRDSPRTLDMPAVILASASRIRRELLERAGVPVQAEAAAVNEAELKAAFRAEHASAEVCAEGLAGLKAMRITARHPAALVIGADQMLDCDGVWFDKPKDLAEARVQLLALGGRTHRLVTAAVIVRGGERLWHVVEAAQLTMRRFTEDFVDAYLREAGDSVLHSVGAYQLEALGAQLFERVEGDFFTILGLPLLPVLGFLRVQGVIRT